MANEVEVVGTIGNPGQTACATFSPLDRGDMVKMCSIIENELIGNDELHDVYYVVQNGVRVTQRGIPVIFTKDVPYVYFKGSKVVHEGIPVVFNKIIPYVYHKGSQVTHNGVAVVHNSRSIKWK